MTCSASLGCARPASRHSVALYVNGTSASSATRSTKGEDAAAATANSASPRHATTARAILSGTQLRVEVNEVAFLRPGNHVG